VASKRESEHVVGNGSKPPFRVILETLRTEIDGGRYQVGGQIPTQQALVRRFGVSRATVQRALEDLRQDGYLDSQQGRGSYVLDRAARRGAGARPLPGTAGVILADHVNTAFEARDVRLDTFSLTTESLSAAVHVPLLRIRAGDIQPRSIRVRVLLPSPGAQLAVPRRVDDAGDARPLERLRSLARSHAVTLTSSIAALADLGLVSDVAVEIRAVGITPLQKVYLFNGTDALAGFYNVVLQSVPIGGEAMEIYDFLGLESLLFHHSSAGPDPDPCDVAYVVELQAWFESLWSTIAEPLTLFE
jgi:hypothetical protein